MAFLKNLFKKKQQRIEPVDLNVIHTDMHSHLVPDIDDGVASASEAMELIDKFYELGYRKLITTPHIQSDTYKNTPEIILNGFEEVKQLSIQKYPDLKLEAAAEYLIDDGFRKKFESGNLMTFGDNHLLIELSYFHAHPDFSQILFDLQIAGFKIILAHPERYTYWFRNFKKLEELKDRGVFFQINLNSISGYYSPEVKKVAEQLIDNNMVEFLGSDMHNEAYMQGLLRTRSEPYLKKLIESGKLLNSSL